MSCEIVALVFAGVGYFAKGFVDLYHKKRNKRSEAADAISPLILEYMRLSADLCGGTTFGSELTLDGCIQVRKDIVRKLVDLERQLHEASDQNMRYLDCNTAQKIKEASRLLSTQLRELSRNFEAADQFVEDGDEVLRIMECGLGEYCNSYEREISPALNEINNRIREH